MACDGEETAEQDGEAPVTFTGFYFWTAHLTFFYKTKKFKQSSQQQLITNCKGS